MASDPNYGNTPFPSMGAYLFTGEFLRTRLSRIFQGGLSGMDTITATAGGTKAAAFALTRTNSHITVCATANDSVLLPAAITGSRITVRNDGVANLAMFGKNTDTINGVATGTATVLAPAKATELICYTRGAWFTLSVQA